MIIWSDFGLLVLLFGGLGIVVAEGLRNLIGPDQYVLCIAAGGIVAAASAWVAGSHLPGRLWFIPIKYYGPIYLVVFGAFAFSEAEKQGFRLANLFEQAPALTETTAQPHNADANARATGAALAEASQKCTIVGLFYKTDGRRDSVVYPFEVKDAPGGPREQGSAVDPDGKRVFPIHIESGQYAGGNLYTETTPDEFKNMASRTQCMSVAAGAANSERTSQNAPAGKATAAAGPPVLSWEIRDEIDQIADKPIRKVFSGGTFGDGVTLEASAFCDPIGMEFAFDTFRGKEGAPFAWKDDKVWPRLRIDGGEIRTTAAESDYTNEAKIVFYDETATARELGQTSPLASLASGWIVSQMRSIAAGTLDELAAARSIRIELPLADGSANVVDLNPADQALAAMVKRCMSDLQASAHGASGRQR